MSVKRWLFLTHRWLGIGLCVLFAMWFVSGVVMMYVGYPKLTETQRLQHLPVLSAQAAPDWLAPRDALDAAGLAGTLASLRLAAASGGVPVYVANHAQGTWVIDAVTGARLETVDRAQALASAQAFAGEGVALAYRDTVDEDAFTHSRALDAHRPLHRIHADDGADTRLYISSLTGEVVRQATRTERGWNYLGAWIHWLYPFRGNLFDAYWTDIVNGLSILGIALTLTGTYVGIQRWRFARPYRSGSRSPYLGRMMRWHHITGLLFAGITLTWIFSGLMSMNPWRIFSSGAPALQVERMQGGPLLIGGDEASPATLLAAARGDVRELRWRRAVGEDVVEAQRATGAPTLLAMRDATPVALDDATVRQAAARLIPDVPVRIDVLTQEDFYYYSRDAHTMTGGRERPLPVWRAVFDDAHATWVHIDPDTAQVIGKLDRSNRASRWLFSLLHSWDWLPLLSRRPAWDVVLILLSLGGLVLSSTGIVIGWRRLRRRWH
ncbi:PepSY domain-containing protein [Achromobacter sp. GG226]|uniref:PepSY domain-containing protein n=1 Tax=Verticiella alkaliphila TaxID=2779529 RepID=UPI001C0B9936|nr:PepSY domain-containing protein [Verticiella sp. GG226]